MAVAGIHNVPVQESLVLGDSRSLESGFHGNPGRVGIRASSVLQICRELEDEYAVSCSHGRARSRFPRQNINGLSSHNVGLDIPRQNQDGFDDASESENGDGSASDAQIGPLSEHEDHQSITSEQSNDLGENERQRVRKIFREWMNNGVTGHRPSRTSGNTSPKSQWLDERELERVRVVREWIQMTAQQGDALGAHKEEQAGERGVQIERVREGLILELNQGQTESPKRGILRLCGRQALLDMLARRVQEVERELKCLVECRAVSSFPFRNRIQSVLRVRFLLNKRLIEDDRPNSAARSELGLLRQQRSTVSDLREGFLSKLGDNSHVPACDHSNSSDSFKDEETQVDCSTEVGDGSNEHSGQVNHETNVGTSLCPVAALAASTSAEENCQGPVALQVATRLEDSVEDGGAIAIHSMDPSAETGSIRFRDEVHSTEVPRTTYESIDFISHHKYSASTSLANTVGPPLSISVERNLLLSVDVQAETGLAHTFDGGERIEEESAAAEVSLLESVEMPGELGLDDVGSDERIQTESTFDELASSDDEGQWQVVYNSRFEDGGSNQLGGANEVLPEPGDIDHEERGIMLQPSGSFQGLAAEQIHGPDYLVDQQEQVTGDGESVSGGSGLTNTWGNVVQEELDWPVENWQGQVVEDDERNDEDSVLSDVWGNHYREDTNESDQEVLQDDIGHGFDNHVASPSSSHMSGSVEEEVGVTQEIASVERDETSYYSDDDNTHRTELRELLSRRRVSSLLHSGFRESLNRLVQSYVERQSQSVREWDLREMSLPAVIQNQELPRIDQSEEPSVANAFSPIQQPPTPWRPPQRRRDQVLHNSTWSRHDMRLRPGTELEMINDLRIDMARLQQRLNTMQRMLETCMDMQLELQRSVRQEVSAALNRPMDSSGPSEEPLLKEGSNLDYVRKGVCCLCCEGKIDSLLYRCGHMCTCEECARQLVSGDGRCPMCQAPVLEVIRAFTIQ